MPVVQDEEVGDAIGGGSGGARAAVDECYLAEEVTRSEAGQPLALTLDDDVPTQDDEELVTALALAHEHLAVDGVNIRCELGQPVEMRCVEIVEERYPPQ